MRHPALTHTQLCDLLNYVLGLPQVIGQKTVFRPAIHPSVVKSWIVKAQYQAEVWCDVRLREAGLGPRIGPSPVGAHPGKHLPRQAAYWVPSYVMRTGASA